VIGKGSFYGETLESSERLPFYSTLERGSGEGLFLFIFRGFPAKSRGTLSIDVGYDSANDVV